VASEEPPIGPSLTQQSLGAHLHGRRLDGLGETYYLPRAVSAIIHDFYAPLLIGRNPLDIENHWNNLFSAVSFFGSMGAEMRAISAIDIALWDLAGKHSGQPIYNLLGGRNRDRVPSIILVWAMVITQTTRLGWKAAPENWRRICFAKASRP